MYIYMYMYIFIYVYMYICIYVSIYIYVCVYKVFCILRTENLQRDKLPNNFYKISHQGIVVYMMVVEPFQGFATL